ncbi:MAG: UDP-N-acetylmuramoylalanyl-D-glutamyl-2,6-diamin opimelate/D-alanyl-D-alanylligase [Acidimicrobiales bacterium]|nr:UDP-N-acetylmuramoylalanyl-D-glutamyl-2,6-diamin opimelate/D-alanyl-D-alanylligase [Acidimicrobiales bacterium]
MRFSTSEVAAATGGELFGRDTEIDGATIDSRRIVPGQLFVPIVAERDGHEFISAAIRAGADAYLTSGPIEAGTAIRVTDTAAALTALGSRARDELGPRVVGVTGSVGKTSLKDLLAAAAATTWPTTASAGSFNNELGVPLTLVNAPDGTTCTIVEMGARGRGHIAALCETARPTVAVVTVVAGVHLEAFGSIDDVAAGKAELPASLPADGTAVLNADDERVAAMASATRATVLTFGTEGRGEVRASRIVLDGDLRPSFDLHSPWGHATIRLAVAGRHQVTNALGAAAAAMAMGATPEAVAEGLAGARLSAMRMDLRTAPPGFRVLDDSYNANPTSMRAAIDALAGLEASGRRIAVLGTMHEIGAGHEAAHREIARYAAAAGIAVVSVAEPAYEVAGEDATDTPAVAVERLGSLALGPDDVVLVKASRAAGLEAVVAALHAPS